MTSRPPEAPAVATVDRSLNRAVAVSGLRCLTAYVVLPGLAPVLGGSGAVAGPLLVALRVLGAMFAARAMQRGLTSGRSATTMFAAAMLSLNLLGLAATVG